MFIPRTPKNPSTIFHFIKKCTKTTTKTNSKIYFLDPFNFDSLCTNNGNGIHINSPCAVNSSNRIHVNNKKYIRSFVTAATGSSTAHLYPAVTTKKNLENRKWATYLLTLIPIITFGLGTWQVQRLRWKMGLINEAQERTAKPPMKLPKNINLDVLDELLYRRVYATGQFRHDQEMLLGIRHYDNKPGYLVITPLERENGSTVLVKRGWISKEKADPAIRPKSQAKGIVSVEGLLRKSDKKNWNTPVNNPDKNQWLWTDLEMMAERTGAQPVLIEQSLEVPHYATNTLIDDGIPIGKLPQVEFRNTHLEYAITWYTLSFATTIMLYILFKKPPPGQVKRQQMKG
ncbi:2914_t:CDS:2 [Ambispora gerdemannii]|uniref:SURF1-like protein n=1 Tax=Ambispora gerdemannii TaxID=144530 RepID=A0A9N8WKS6_9GLOM|nr:2914_t:CDS:2 [Ambispora gerdemannii]